GGSPRKGSGAAPRSRVRAASDPHSGSRSHRPEDSRMAAPACRLVLPGLVTPAQVHARGRVAQRLAPPLAVSGTAPGGDFALRPHARKENARSPHVISGRRFYAADMTAPSDLPTGLPAGPSAPAGAGGEPSAGLRRRYDRATADLEPPLAIVDLDALRANAADLVRRAGGKPIPVPSKSVPCRAVLERVLAMDGFSGILAFTLPEALWLAGHGFTDIVVAYPTADRRAIAR